MTPFSHLPKFNLFRRLSCAPPIFPPPKFSTTFLKVLDRQFYLFCRPLWDSAAPFENAAWGESSPPPPLWYATAIIAKFWVLATAEPLLEVTEIFKSLKCFIRPQTPLSKT